MNTNESTSTADLFSFTLPSKHKPGSDLMSKLILDDKRASNIIVNELIGMEPKIFHSGVIITITNCFVCILGQQAVNQYLSRPTEWPNQTKSDVLYTLAGSKSSVSLPPVLVEVQYTANMSFYRRLIDYGLSVSRRHKAAPAILAIITHNTTAELSDLAVVSQKHPFLLELPCCGWAQSCYLLNAASISDYLEAAPLNPLVAIGHVFLQQKVSLGMIQHSGDETVKLVYSIAREIYGDGSVFTEKVFTEQDLEEIRGQCVKAKLCLLEDVKDKKSRKRTLDCLDQVLAKVTQQKKKIDSGQSKDLESSEVKDWLFVKEYHKEHGDFDWKMIFDLGKEKSLFSRYSSSNSTKAAFYKYEKSKQQ